MEKIITQVGINEFVLRQTKGSGKTYTETLSLENIADHAQVQISNGKYQKGYRDGVILVNASNTLKHHFICPFVKIDEKSKLKAKMVQRRPKEKPYVQIRALNGKPMTTGSVKIILYHHDVLSETKENTTSFDWELISFHAIPEGINDGDIRSRLLNEFHIEIGGGLGPLVGKIWRIGLMGETAKKENIQKLMDAFRKILN